MTDIDQDGAARPYPDWAYDDGYAPRQGVAVPLLIGGIVQFFVSLMVPKPDLAVMSTGTSRELAAAGGEMIAVILLPVAVIGLVLYFAFFRSRDPRGIWKIPLVLLPVAIFATLLSSVVGYAMNEGEQRRLAQRSIAETSRRYVESDGRDAGPLRHSGATGEFGEVERVMLDFYGDLSRRQRQYEEDIAVLVDVFEPATMRGPADAARAANAGAGLPEVIRTYVAELRSSPQQLRERLDQANLSAATRREMLEGFEEGFAGAADVNVRIQDLELEVVEAALELLAVLRRTSWERDRAGNFLFSSDSALRQFEPVRIRLERVSQEQQRLIAERRGQVMRRLRTFERTR